MKKNYHLRGITAMLLLVASLAPLQVLAAGTLKELLDSKIYTTTDLGAKSRNVSGAFPQGGDDFPWSYTFTNDFVGVAAITVGGRNLLVARDNEAGNVAWNKSPELVLKMLTDEDNVVTNNNDPTWKWSVTPFHYAPSDGNLKGFDDYSLFTHNNWVIIDLSETGKNATSYVGKSFNGLVGQVDFYVGIAGLFPYAEDEGDDDDFDFNFDDLFGGNDEMDENTSGRYDVRVSATAISDPGADAPTKLNTYNIANMAYDSYFACNANALNDEAYYLCTPAPGEVATIEFATYEALTTPSTVYKKDYDYQFVCPTNAQSLTGAAAANMMYFDGDTQFQEGESYKMTALISARANQDPSKYTISTFIGSYIDYKSYDDTTGEPVICEYSMVDNGSYYVIFPLSIEKIVTGVEMVKDVPAEVTGVAYYDLQGRMSATPHSGVNIKVTTLSDGTTQTVKVLH